MTTATKSTSAELAKLEQIRDKAHEKVRASRAKFDEWQTKGLPGEIRPGSAGADLHAARREQKLGPNPHRAKFDAHLAAFHALDGELQAFKRARIHDRIAEVTIETDAEEISEAWTNLRAKLEHYRLAIEEVRAIILGTPGLNGQALGYDGRIEGWHSLCLEALVSLDERELVKPGLTDVGAWEVNQ